MESVLRLGPRTAVLDCDGTLWADDAGEAFFYWEMERGLIPREVAERAKRRYDQYRAGQVGEAEMCGAMVTIHAGLPEAEIARAAEEFVGLWVVPRVFPALAELTRRLKQNGCELWAVSSTNEWVARAGAGRFGISAERVLAACVAIEDGRATDRLRRVPTDEAKAEIIREVIGAADAVFGNSIHDLAMLEIAKHAFAVSPTPGLEGIARQRGWVIYQP